jgi:CRISPR/Cas system-associated exonuclease Cas4 (RecB family)
MDLESEKYLRADFDGITIAGYADFAWSNFVADAKTGKKKSGAELLRDRVQVQAYSAILAKHSNQSVLGELWYLSPKDPSVVSTGVAGEPEGETPVFHDVLDSLKFAVEKGAFPAVGKNTGELGTTCLYCDFNKICPTDVHDRWEELEKNGDFSKVHPIEEQSDTKVAKGKDT